MTIQMKVMTKVEPRVMAMRRLSCKNSRIVRHDKQRGSMLLEALIAILIFSMGILAIVGLQSSAVSFTTDAKYRTDACFLANQSIGQMWVDRANLASYVVTDAPVAALPSGKRTIAVAGNTVTVTIKWQVPGGSSEHRFVTVAQING